MKRLFVAAVLITLVIGLVACAAPGQKIGVINVTKVLEDSKRAQEYQTQLDARKTEVQQQLEDNVGNLDEDERATEYQKAYQELDQLGRELGQQLHTDIENAVQKVAEEQDLDIVINNKAVLYGGEDITGEVIDELGGPIAQEEAPQEQGTDNTDEGQEDNSQE